jgi:hypothetical protein
MLIWVLRLPLGAWPSLDTKPKENPCPPSGEVSKGRRGQLYLQGLPSLDPVDRSLQRDTFGGS